MYIEIPQLTPMNWLLIKHFGKIKYFNISYAAILLIPIAKEIIDKLNTNIGRQPYFLPHTLVLLYAASLFYALAVAIYQFFCPSIIKAYDKEQDYIRDNMEIHMTAYPDLKLQIIRTNLREVQVETLKKIEDLVLENSHQSKQALEKEFERLLPSSIQHFLSGQFTEATTKYKWLIFFAFFLYIIGTGIVLYLLFRKSYFVLFT